MAARILKIFKILMFLNLTISCSLGPTDQISLIFPELPEGFSFDSEESWTLEILDGSGDNRRQDIRFAPGKSVQLEVRKEIPLVCLLSPPSLSEHFEPHPAGGLFVPGEPAIFELTWPGGAGASFLISAASGGLDLNRINLRRLFDGIIERGAPDPWFLDWDLLGRQLAKGEMRIWYIRKKHSYELEIPFPAGRWRSISFWLDPLICNGSEKQVLNLSAGAHFYRNSETCQDFVIVVEDSGEFYTLLYEV